MTTEPLPFDDEYEEGGVDKQPVPHKHQDDIGPDDGKGRE